MLSIFSSSFLQTIERIAASGKYPDGTALAGSDHRVVAASVSVAQRAVPEWRRTSIELPDVTFDSGMVRLQLGALEAHVVFPGRGNTSGDAVVYLPARRVLVTGALVVAPIPYAYGAFISDWLVRLADLQSFDASAIVPGHGNVLHSFAYVALLRELGLALSQQVRDGVRQGLVLAATRDAVRLDSFRSRLAGTDADMRAAFDVHFLAPAVQRTFEEVTRAAKR